MQVKEVALANLFMPCGKIVDCRLCCDPNSALRFAFIEFDSEAAVEQVNYGWHATCYGFCCCIPFSTKCLWRLLCRRCRLMACS
jgi:RNA recognition motif. (a.k.a. RRM, RBD, or RNP domain)